MRIVALIPQQGGPKNLIFFEKRKKSFKTQKFKNVQRFAKICDTPFDQRSLIHREAWFPPCFVNENQQKTNFFFALRFQTTFKQKCPNLRRFFSLLFPKDYESLKILDIRLWEVGTKKRLNGTSKVNTQTDGHTDRRTHRQTDGHFDLQKASAQRADALKIYYSK